MTLKHKGLPRDMSDREKLASMIRVDHAGEYGARKIYEGQLAIFKKHREIEHMHKQELVHLEFFEKEMIRRKVRPTVLMPMWRIGGFVLGAVSALLGEKAAMACTIAVEEIIDEHYQQQIDELNHYREEELLKAKIKRFRAEELEHRDTGVAHNAEQMLGYTVFTKAVRAITKTAIFLSKRW